MYRDRAREWKQYQRDYFRQKLVRIDHLLKKIRKPRDQYYLKREKRLLLSQSVRIRQISVPSLARHDRCITCHVGYDVTVNPGQEKNLSDHPFSVDPLSVHRIHPFDDFGCTVCHEGQGLGTTLRAAHGEVSHWDKPMMRGYWAQVTCSKCHTNLWDAHAMPDTSLWRRGEELFLKKGCIGCHQTGGVGGAVSVDLMEETPDKPLSQIDFSHVGINEGRPTLALWIKLHFVRNPAELVPGDPQGRHNSEPIAPSGMPFFNLSSLDADALSIYLLSFARDPHIPLSMVVNSPPRPTPLAKTKALRGRAVYEKYGCSGCHGEDGRGGVANFNSASKVTPDLLKVIGTYTRPELKKKLFDGVPLVRKENPGGPTPPIFMPGWRDQIIGQELEDLMDYLFGVAESIDGW